MIRTRKAFVLATASVVALAACEPAPFDPNDPGKNQRQGAIIGGVTGVVTGLISGDDAKERRNRAILGGAIGAGTGALIGRDLDNQARDLEAAIGNDRVRIVNTGEELIVTMPQDILFDIDSDFVRSDLQGDLRALAGNLQQYPNSIVEVVGHTDNTGGADYNQQLSTRRAQAVTNVLIQSGVSSQRIRSFGQGENVPVASNLTPEGRSQNRRVDIIIRPTT